MNRARHAALAGIAFAMASAAAPASAATNADTIGWSALRPPEQASPAKGGLLQNVATGEILSTAFGGKTVSLAGYLLPVDQEGDLVYEFILMPLSGLCSHMPPPPPNQAVHVYARTPYKLAEIYEAVTVTGVLTPDIEKTQLVMIDGTKIIESGYRIGKAGVARAAGVADGGPPRQATPWSFLNKESRSWRKDR